MSKFFKWIKNNFLTKSFLIFCIIGVLNTLINALVMEITLKGFDLISSTDISIKESGAMYYVSMGVSTLLAFVVASIFSYFANAKFTYKAKKKDGRTFIEAFLAFALRFALTYLFTLLIYALITLIFKIETDPSGLYRTLSNLIASVVMIPPFYLFLGLIFKKSNDRLEKEEDNVENAIENEIQNEKEDG